MKKILFFAGILICVVTINGLARSIYDLWHKQDVVVSARIELEKEKKENERLKQQLVLVNSQEFIESEARNKLLMVKPGEEGVIVPSDLIEKKAPKKVSEPPNWQKWINLFF